MRTLRIAVTGLKRAGKTVFLTSLINHLIEGREDTFEAFNDEAVAFTAAPLPQRPGRAAFPYHRYLDDLQNAEPSWPERTTDMTEFHLALTLRNLRTHRMRAVALELVDYPGERLLDLPLLNMSYGEWSDGVLRDAEVGARKALSSAWLERCTSIPANAGADGDAAAAVVAEYRAYLHACRERGLVFLQPSVMLLDDGEAKEDPSRFCPLPQSVGESAEGLGRDFEARYEAYVRDRVKPFFRAVGRCSRQIVLVDVMHVLRCGVHSYNDSRRCLRSVLDAFAYAQRRRGLSPLRLLDMLHRRIERVAFVATKADQCTRATRGNLRYLLEELVNQKHRELLATLPHARPRITFCAALRATEDASKQYEGRDLSCLRGLRADRPADKDGPWFPGEIPLEWPEDDWNPEQEQFVFPDFLPRRLPMRDGAALPHINLDKVFWHVVEDVIT